MSSSLRCRPRSRCAARTRRPPSTSSCPRSSRALTMSEWRSAQDTARRIVQGELTAAAAVEAYLARIAKLDDQVGAYLTVDADGARAQAAEIARKRKAGEPLGPLGGMPTYGRVSRWGVVAFASSLDQVGPLTRTVGDAALLLETSCGHDPHDSTSLDQTVPKLTDAQALDVAG